MQIGYFAQGEGEHLEIAKHLIESAKRVMPEVGIFQLTDEDTPILDGAEGIRLPGDMPMGVRRITHYSQLSGDWLLLDTDIVFRSDVRDVFDAPFDVALVSRAGTYMEGTKYAEQNPYNTGVVFSRNGEFWKMLLPHLRSMPHTLQEWGGEQLLTGELARQAMSPFSVKILPSSYNFTPYYEKESLEGKHIIHYKGPRKAWITM